MWNWSHSGPVPLQKIAVEEAERHDRLVEGRGPELLLIAQVDEMIEHHALGDLFERALGVPGGELAHLAQILRLAPPAERF